MPTEDDVPTATTIERLWFIDGLATLHARGEETDGAYDLVEVALPAGDMPPLHVHHTDDELFYVLEGRVTFFVGPETIELEAGHAARAPKAIPHTYRVESDG